MEENKENDLVEENVTPEQPETETVEVMDETEQKMEALTQQAAENLDKYQRCLAEFDNFRKRTTKEKAAMYDDGVRDTIEKLLIVVDNLERAVSTQEGKNEDSFFKGVQMTLKQFLEVLHGLGVEEIKALGEQFDPNVHAAVAHEEDENYGANEIVLEMLKGYKYKDKVIRHSMVKVVN